MKHPVYFYCMLAVCCAFVGSKFLTRASEGNMYPELLPNPNTQEERNRAINEENTTKALLASVETLKEEGIKALDALQKPAPQQYEPYTNPKFPGDAALVEKGRAIAATQLPTQQYPTSHAQPTAQLTQPAAQAATPAQLSYWEMAVAKATALKSYLAGRWTALRSYLGW